MLEDKIRWDLRYRENNMPLDPSDILVDFIEKLPRGKALDIACGNGRNSKFLAKHDFVCDAIDISQEALKFIDHPDIKTYCLDLDNYRIQENLYDVVVNFYFLDRRILKQIPAALKPQGAFLLETFIEDKEYEGGIDSKKILKQGELEEIFENFEILLHTQKWIVRNKGEKAKIVSFVAKKIC